MTPSIQTYTVKPMKQLTSADRAPTASLSVNITHFNKLPNIYQRLKMESHIVNKVKTATSKPRLQPCHTEQR